MSDTLASILKQAEAHGILLRKVVKGKVTEYLPTHPGEASTANKGEQWIGHPSGDGWVEHPVSTDEVDYSLTVWDGKQMSVIPPKPVQQAATLGLELRRQFGRGGTEVGVARARDLSNGRAVSEDTLTRMRSYFARHAVDAQADGWKDEANPSAGWIAWLLWGGDEGRDWVEGLLGEQKWLTAEKAHTGAMLALYPDTPPTFTLQDPDLTPTAPDELHVTMAYLGNAADLDEEDRAFLRRLCTQIASEFSPISATLGGIGRFLNVEDDDTQAYYASVDSPDVEKLRARLVEVLGALGMIPENAHGFTPHMTLAYVPVGKPAAGAGLQEEPVEFGKLSLSLGGEREDFPFGKSGEKQNFMLSYPDENKTQRFVFQAHARGKGVHGDFRVQSGDYLVGWTIPMQQPGAIKEPIETLPALTAAVNNPDLWKMDLKTGEIKPREIRGGVVRKGDLRALPKGVEIPEDWLNEQGVTDKPDPGEAIPVGATRNYPGVFKIVDKGTVEHGAKKPWLQELWIHGDKWGTQRWLFRLLERGQKYSPGQPRDEGGRWAGEGGASFAHSHLPSDVRENLPTEGRLGSLASNALDRLSSREKERESLDSPYKQMSSEQLLEVHDRLGRQVSTLKASAKTNPSPEQEANLKRFEDRRKLSEKEIQFRKDYYDDMRQVVAASEGQRTGKIVLDKNDVSQLLSHPSDVYVEAGIKPSGGKFPYRPELFKTSDLSGKKVREYVSLPDGRIGHPDEIREARSRGRLLVVESIKVPSRDWTSGEKEVDHALQTEGWEEEAEEVKQDTLPPGVIESNPRSETFWVFLQPTDQSPYVLSSEAVSKSWLPPKGVSALPKVIRDRVPKELRYWEVSGKEALDRRAKLAEMDVRELGGSSAKQLGPWQPYRLQYRYFRGPIQVRFGASTKFHDLWLADGTHYVIDGDPLTNDRLATYQEHDKPTVSTADGKRVSVLRIGSDPVELAPGQPANPTKDTPAFVQTVDEGEVRVLDSQPEFTKLEFKGGKLEGAWYFRLESPDSKIGEFGKSEGPQTGAKYSPEQVRDEQGRWSSGGGLAGRFPIMSGRERDDFNTLRDAGLGPPAKLLAPHAQWNYYAGKYNEDRGYSQAEKIKSAGAKALDADLQSAGVTDIQGRDFQDAWAFSSSDEGGAQDRLQAEAARRIGNKSKFQTTEGMKLVRPGEDKAAQVAYNSIQSRTAKQLAEKGIKPDDELVVYRGIIGPYAKELAQGGVGGELEINSARPLSSWSLDPLTAHQFAGLEGVVVATPIKAKDIFSFYTSGLGCASESEVILPASATNKAQLIFAGPRSKSHQLKRMKVELDDSNANADWIRTMEKRHLRKAGEKGVRPLFGSPGGKRILAKTIVDLIPPHKVYVEPFAGGAAVLFAKPPEMSEKEVLADADPDIAFAYRTVKGLSDAEIEKLNGMEWRIGKFDEVKDSSPDGKLGKLHKWLYLRKSSQGALSGNQNLGQPESRDTHARNLPNLRDRLASTQVRHADYQASLKEWDGKDTFFYLDPPYPETDLGAAKADLRWTDEDCAAFAKALKSLKGKWLVSLQDNQTNRDLFKGYSIRTVSVPTVFNTGGGKGNDRRELLIANYPLPKRVRRKSMDEIEALQLVYTCSSCKGEFESETVLGNPRCPGCADKALTWRPYLLQRHNDHHDLRIGDDFTLRLSGTLLDNEPDQAEVSTESPTLQGADGQAVDALKVKPGDPVKLSDGEVQTLDKGQARYAKVQQGHQVEFKGGKLEGVYLFGKEGAHPIDDLEHIDVEWEPGQPEPESAEPEGDGHPPLFPFDPGQIHPPHINPDLIHPLNPPLPNIPGTLPPPGMWYMGEGEVAVGWKIAPPSTAEKDVVELEEKDKPSVDEGEKVGKRIKTEKLSKLQELRQSLESAVKWLGEVIGWASYEDAPTPSMLDFFKGSDFGFTVKTVQGEPWLFTWSANAFKDREGEIFSTKALESWADRASEREDKGTYNFWHIPGSDFAVKKWVGVPGRFLVEAGPFTKDAKGQAAQKFFATYPDRHPTLAPEGWGCSVEYRYLPEERKKGVYQNVEITRTSVLPRFAAANTWTAVKEVTMALTDAQKKAAQELFGEDLAASILGEAEAKTKELEPNVAHKGEGEQTEPEAPAVPPEAEQVAPESEDDKAKKKPAAEVPPDEEYPKPTKAEKKSLDQFVKAIRGIAESVTDDSAGRTALLEVADNLSEENLKDMAAKLKKAGKVVGRPDQKSRLAALVEALAGDGVYPAPAKKEFDPDAPEFITSVAAEISKQFKFDTQPIGEALTATASALKGLEDRIAALETQSGHKAATDLPRFVFGLVEQASKADSTIVPEGDKLLDQKPKETQATADGSIAAHFFTKPK